ncbi:MAG: aspartate kinase [Thermoplasmata archaeon]
MTRARRRLVVLKFGGASVGDPARIAERTRRLRRGGVRVVIVASARAGVTDLLKGILERPRDRAAHRRAIARVARAHAGAPAAGTALLRRLGQAVSSLEEVGAADPAVSDRLLSYGERLAVVWLADALAGRGVPAVPVEADRIGLVTDGQHGRATVLLERSRRPVRRALGRILARGDVPVVTGYFGRSLEGRIATLGRGGSDYSATALGAILGAARVELVKRDVAVLSADPRLVPTARPIRRLSYEEAEELAQFGAKVLHPLTVEPAKAHGIELVVRPLDQPGASTTIGPPRGPDGMRAISALAPLALIRVRVPGGRQRPGIVAEVTDRLRELDINIVTLFTSSSCLSVVLDRASAARARRGLAALAREGSVALEGPVPVSLVTAIGDGVLDDLGRLPLQVLARGEGLSATPRSLSFAVPVHLGARAVRALHRALVEAPRR